MVEREDRGGEAGAEQLCLLGGEGFEGGLHVAVERQAVHAAGGLARELGLGEVRRELGELAARGGDRLEPGARGLGAR